MSKKVTASSKTYQIRPPFKDKFRPGVISQWLNNWTIGSQGKDWENRKREAEERTVQLIRTSSVDKRHCRWNQVGVEELGQG